MKSYSKSSQLKKKTLKEKPCRYSKCKKPFIPKNGKHTCCTYLCGIGYAQEQTAKNKAAEKRAALKAHNQADKSYMFEKAKQAVQKYARLRDYGQPCISCGRGYFSCQIHGGHFMPGGNNHAIVFNLWNIHAQCAQCNNSKSGNLIDYEITLRKKIGDDKVEWLKSQKQPKSFDLEYLHRIVKIFHKRNSILGSRIFGYAVPNKGK